MFWKGGFQGALGNFIGIIAMALAVSLLEDSFIESSGFAFWFVLFLMTSLCVAILEKRWQIKPRIAWFWLGFFATPFIWVLVVSNLTPVIFEAVGFTETNAPEWIILIPLCVSCIFAGILTGVYARLVKVQVADNQKTDLPIVS